MSVPPPHAHAARRDAARPPWRGYALLLLSVLLNGSGIHFINAGLRESSPLTMLGLNSGIAATLFFVLGWLWKRLGWRMGKLDRVTPREVYACFRSLGPYIFLPPSVAAIGGWIANACIQRYGPETTAFLFNQTLVFLVLSGFLFLRERPARMEWAAIAVVVAGAFLYSYEGGRFQWAALLLMAVACVAVTAKQVLVKQLSIRQPLPIVMVLVLIGNTLWAAFFAVVTQSWVPPTPAVIGYAACTAVCTNICGMVLLYSGYHIVGVSRGAPINAMRPLAVLLIGLALGGALPGGPQILGGACILGGSALLALLHNRAHRESIAQSLPLVQAGGAAE